MSSEGEQCEAKYGLLPCSTELGPSLFLMAVYGYCLLGGANLLSDGSELLLEILNPGLIGGLVLPILGALPDSLIILFSGLNGKKAADAVAVGVGTLAGSTVMLLTIAWGGGLLLGRCDLENGVARDRTLTRPFSVASTGVTTDAAAPGNSIIMIATTSLYFLVQGPAWLGHDSPKAAMLGGSLCFLVLAMYCCYMVVVPELQKRKIAAARQRLQRQVALHHFIQAGSSYGGMLNEDHEVNREVVDVIFDQIDDDGNQVIDKQELRGLILGLDVGLNTDVSHLEADMQAWMREFDMDRGGTISRDEFFCIIKKWVGERMEGQKLRISSADDSMHSPPGDVESASAASPLVPEGEDDGEEEDDGFEDNDWKLMSNAQILRRSLAMLVAGTAICAFFSDPMVEAVSNFATASKLPTFIVAFVITPFASNASELVSSLRFAMRKKSRNISLTFSQVYGAVTMNNTMCLGLFFFVVGLNKLPWNYGPQVITTAGSTLLIGLLGSSSRTFRTYWGFIALLVYPLAIGAMHLLESHTNLAA